MNLIAVFDPNSSFNPEKISGKICFHQCTKDSNTFIKVELSGFEPNTIHASHIHEFGDMTEGCKSACEHYNPLGEKHGNYELHGDKRHVGDMMNNLEADNEGNVYLEFEDDLIDLWGKYSIAGRSVVIHGKEDDLGKYRDLKTSLGIESGKSGNAGSRIACAIIGVSKKNYHPEKQENK
jgi:Cu-Zn family superoxide dismutase